MARSKSAGAAAAAAASSAAPKSAGLKKPSKVKAEPAAAAAAAKPVKNKKKKKAAAAAAAAAAPKEEEEEAKPARKHTESSETRRRRADRHEALAVSGEFPHTNRAPVQVRPAQWKRLVVLFAGKDARVGSRALDLIGQASLGATEQVIAEANHLKLAMITNPKVRSESRLTMRIQERHIEEAARRQLLQIAGPAAVQRYQELLEQQDVEHRAIEAEEKEAAKEYVAHVERKKRLEEIEQLPRMRQADLDEQSDLLHLEDLYNHKLQLRLVKKLEKTRDNAKAELAYLEDESQAKHESTVKTLKERCTEDKIIELQGMLRDAAAAYDSFHEEHAAPIYASVPDPKDRTPEQKKVLKEAAKMEAARVRVRKELQEEEHLLAKRQARLKKLVEQHDAKHEAAIAACRARLAKTVDALEDAVQNEKETKKKMDDYNRRKRAAARKAAAAAAAAEPEDMDEGED